MKCIFLLILLSIVRLNASMNLLQNSIHDKVIRSVNDLPLKPSSKLSEKNSISPSSFVFMERAKISRRHDIKKQGRAHPKSTHEVVFALKKRNMNRLKELLDDISNPFSDHFGQHMTKEKVTDMTSNPKAKEFLKKYLNDFDSAVHIVNETPFGGYLTIRASVESLEKLFSTKFYVYQQDGKKNSFIRAIEYSLPKELTKHVSAVFAVVDLPLFKRNRYQSVEVVKPDIIPPPIELNFVTPALINQYYEIDSNIGSMKTSQAVYESEGQTFSRRDLEKFDDSYNISKSALAYINVIGGHDPRFCPSQDACGEANLDMQYIMGISQVTNTTYFYDGGSFYGWLVNVTSLANPPKIFSISYSAPEYDFTAAELNSFDEEAIILSMQGVTLFAASGDDGVADNVARSTAGASWYCTYSPSFPASSPYVTSIGGTQGPESNNPEVVCQGNTGGVITSGGGFSNIHPRPSWQNAAITAFLSNTTAVGGYNVNGRGYPDLTGLAANYRLYIQEELVTESGTSASTPLVAAMVSLVNAARVEAGKGTLGWINPSLYALQSSGGFINDITSGINNCVAQGTICCSEGFPAIAGWDAASGLGSLKFPQFKSTFFELGSPLNVPTMSPAFIPPSAAPTPPLPVLDPGYLYQYTYATSECSGEIINVEAVPTGICLKLNHATGSPTPYVKYECYNGGRSTGPFAQATIYSDDSCTNPPSDDYYGFNLPVSFYSGCNSMESFYYSNVYNAQELLCSADALNTTPVPGGEFINVQFYDSKTRCDTSKLSEIFSFRLDYCFTEPPEPSNGYYGSTPTGPTGLKITRTAATGALEAKIYLDISCTGVPASTFPLTVGTCNPPPEGTEIDTFLPARGELSYEYVYVSIASTSSPSFAPGQPTPLPSLAPIGIPPTFGPTPTFRPTRSPSAARTSAPFTPSASPTLRPTYAALVPTPYPTFEPTSIPGITMYVHLNVYVDSTCSGDIELIRGTIAGQCQTLYNTSNPTQILGYQLQYCTATTAVTQKFSDSSCTNKVGADVVFPLEQCFASDSGAFSAQCSPTPPFPSYGEYLVVTNYNNIGCNISSTNQIMSYNAFLNMHCFTENGTTTSYYFDGSLNAQFYFPATRNCTGNKFKNVLPTNCFERTDSGHDDDGGLQGLYSKYSFQSYTLSPVILPTARPSISLTPTVRGPTRSPSVLRTSRPSTPTFIPTSAPSYTVGNPTPLPTSPPSTTGTMYIHTNTYNDERCSSNSDVITIRASIAGQCQPLYNESNPSQIFGYQMQHCEGGGNPVAVTQRYNDSSCTYIVSNPTSIPLNVCSPNLGSENTATETICAPTAPFPSFGEYVEITNYDDQCQSSVMGYDAFLNLHCFSQTLVNSYKFDGLVKLFYPTSIDCTGQFTNYTLPTTCQDRATLQHDDDGGLEGLYFNYAFRGYSSAPTTMPTFSEGAPTPLPSISIAPSVRPSARPTAPPTVRPSTGTSAPSIATTPVPSSSMNAPTVPPSMGTTTPAPSSRSNAPSPKPTAFATNPTLAPSLSPTFAAGAPTPIPTLKPSPVPSIIPSPMPSFIPSPLPTAPSPRPTPLPTFSVPTSAPVVTPTAILTYSFAVTQLVNGVPASAWTDGSETIFKSVIFELVPAIGDYNGDVIVTGVTAATASALSSSLSLTAANLRRDLQSSSSIVDYTIFFQSTEVNEPSELNTILSELAEVTSGSPSLFTTILIEEELAAGFTVFSSASADPAVPSSAANQVFPTAAPSVNPLVSKLEKNKGLVIGVVVAVILVTICACGGLFYYIRLRNKAKAEQFDKWTNDAVGGVADATGAEMRDSRTKRNGSDVRVVRSSVVSFENPMASMARTSNL